MFEFSGRQFIDFMSYMARFEQAFNWLVDAISGVIDVIKSSPLYYVPITLVTLVLLFGAISMLIFNISDRGYSQGSIKPIVSFFKVRPFAFFSRHNNFYKRQAIADFRVDKAYRAIKNGTRYSTFKSKSYYNYKKSYRSPSSPRSRMIDVTVDDDE